MSVKSACFPALSFLRIVAFVSLCVLMPVDVRGQEASRPETVPAEPQSEIELIGDTVPRGAVRAYLEAARLGEYEEAARYLDLSLIEPAERESTGPILARQLRVVLERTLSRSTRPRWGLLPLW